MTNLDSDNTSIISFNDLHHALRADPLYGEIISAATECILRDIYADNDGNVSFEEFKRRYSLFESFNKEPQRELIYIWCGLLGLSTFTNDNKYIWQWGDIFQVDSVNFQIKLDDLKLFMRRHSYSLPYKLFPHETDNSKKKAELDEKENFLACIESDEAELKSKKEKLEKFKQIKPTIDSFDRQQDMIFEKEAEIIFLEKIIKESYELIPNSKVTKLEDTNSKTTNSDDLSTAFDPLPLSGIAKMFKIHPIEDQNLDKWKKYSLSATRNELDTSRIVVGKGRRQSTFDPLLVGEWLIIKGLKPRDIVMKKLSNNLPQRSKHLQHLFDV